MRSPCTSSTSSAALLQAQFGEDAHQHHDSHHAAYDVDDELCAVPVLVLLALCDGGHRLAGVGPDGRVVVGADPLIQPLLAELAAEAIEAGAAAVQKDAGVAVEWRVPLAHHVVVTLATSPTDRRDVLVIRISTAGGSGQTCLLRSVLCGLHVAGSCLVGQRGDEERVTFSYSHRGDGWVLGEGGLSYNEGEEEEEEKVAEGNVGGCHVAGRAVQRPSCRLWTGSLETGAKVLKTKEIKLLSDAFILNSFQTH